MNYYKKVKEEHITNNTKVLAIIKEMQGKIDFYEKTLLQYEQPVPKINMIDGVPNMLASECCGGLNLKCVSFKDLDSNSKYTENGLELDFYNKRSR